MVEQSNQISDLPNLRDLLTILFKHKYKILITFPVVLAIALIIASQVRPSYEARSVILVKLGREFLQRPEEGAGTGFSIPPQTIIAGEIGVLTSRDVLGKAVAAIGPESLYPALGNTILDKEVMGQVAINLFAKSLNVASAPGSNLVHIVFTHDNPYLAAKAVNALVDAFKERHLEVFGGQRSGFLESQQKVFQGRLRESESNLAIFKERNRIYALEEQKTALIQQRGVLDVALREAQNRKSELEQKIAFIQGSKWMSDTPLEPRMRASSGHQQDLSILQQQLAALEQKEREYLQKYTENSGLMQSLRQDIKVVKDAIKKASETAREELNQERQKAREEQRQIELAKAENDLEVAKMKVGSLQRQLERVDGDTRSLEAHTGRLQGLKREVAEDDQNYQIYARKLEESLIQDDMDRRKMIAVSVVEKAVPSILPKKPRFDQRRMIAMGLFGGIAAGIALAFFLEFLAHGMTTPSAAEKRLGLRVMVAIAKK